MRYNFDLPPAHHSNFPFPSLTPFLTPQAKQQCNNVTHAQLTAVGSGNALTVEEAPADKQSLLSVGLLPSA
ncbi:hypothetical protein ACLKA7_013497 [Drosophila subpalustris]